MARWTLVSATAPAPELKREQDYLGAAREALARMREQTLSLKVQAHDPISAEHLARTLHLRAASLAGRPLDDAVLRPDRHRHRRALVHRAPPRRRHRGRPARHRLAGRHVDGVLPGLPHRADGRGAAAPVRARPRRHHGLRGRAPPGPRRARHPQPDPGRGDRAPARRARCATSSPPSSPSRTRSSAPAPTRRSASRARPAPARRPSGLHRAAWLLYAFRDRLARSGVLVIGPNRAFLEHIGAVLPALGEVAGRPHHHRGARGLGAGPRHRQHRDRCPQGRCAPRRGAPVCRVVGRAARRPSRSWCRAACASGASRHTRSTRSSTS